MKSKLFLGAALVIGAAYIGSSAYAAEVVVVKPVVHHYHHHHVVVVVKPAPAKPVMVVAHPMRHRMMMGADAKERAETAKLNEEQVMMNGMQK